MTPPKVLTFLDSFRGHGQLSRVVLVHIQEIIVEVGRFSTTTAAGHFSLAGTTIWARLVAVADALESLVAGN